MARTMKLDHDLYLDLTRLSIDERLSDDFREACRRELGDRREPDYVLAHSRFARLTPMNATKDRT
jgi:hypothetical protein